MPQNVNEKKKIMFCNIYSQCIQFIHLINNVTNSILSVNTLLCFCKSKIILMLAQGHFKK